MITKEQIKITDEEIEKQRGQVMIGNRLRGCRSHIKPVKRNGKWGLVRFGHHRPFSHAIRTMFEGKEMYVQFYEAE